MSESDVWVNTRTGELFTVTATSGHGWSLPERPTADALVKVMKPWPGEAVTATPAPEGE